jgi:hypothetical protein
MPRIYNPNVSLITHAVWMKKTSASVFGVRSKELEAIDRRLLRFERATSAYGKEWEANEVRIALDNYAKKNPKWKDSDRNKSGAFTDLDFSLRLMGLAQPLAATEDSELAIHLRMGALFFLSKCKSDLVPADWGSFINDSVDASSDVHGLVVTGRKQGSVSATKDAVAQAFKGAKGENASDGFLKSLVDSIRTYLATIAGPVNEALKSAITAIGNMLPELLKTILGAMLQNLGAAVDIIGNLAKAGRAAAATFSSRHLEEGVMSGHPRTVINAVREQIKDYGYDAVKDAVKTALITGINVANPIAGSVVAAIAAVYKFVTELYARIKDRVKLTGLIVDAKIQLRAGLHRKASNFNTWFLKAIADLPALSSYCLCMPMTGSYYGFLTLVSTDGSPMNYDRLERNYGEFNDVKVWARKFIQADKIKLQSDDKLVKHSLAVARGETGSELKGGLGTRLTKSLYIMVEKVAA